MTNSLVNPKCHKAGGLLLVLLWLGSDDAALYAVSTAVDNQDSALGETEGTSLLNPVAQKPILQPKESVPLTGVYSLLDIKGKVCMKASMGVEYMVTTNKKNLYFNIDPQSTVATGFCGKNASRLLLRFTGGYLEFSFVKEEMVSYVSRVKANLRVPNCNGCKSKHFTGINGDDKLFETANGLCFKCTSATILEMAVNLRLKIENIQIQALQISDGRFGKEVECRTDYNKRIIPIILGATAVGFCLIAVVVFLILREHRGRGYERL